MASEQDILNQVTGSNGYLGSQLATGTAPQTYGIVAPQVNNGAIINLDLYPGPNLGTDPYSQLTVPGANPGSLTQTFGDFLQGLNQQLQTATNISQAPATSASNATNSFWSGFTGGIAQLGTIIVGALFIAAGLFSLAGGKAIHIIETVKP